MTCSICIYDTLHYGTSNKKIAFMQWTLFIWFHYMYIEAMIEWIYCISHWLRVNKVHLVLNNDSDSLTLTHINIQYLAGKLWYSCQ